MPRSFFSGSTNIGRGGYRYTGSFGNSGGLGNYSVGMAMVIIAYGVRFSKNVNLITKGMQYVYLFLLFMISWASGARSSMISILLLSGAYTLSVLYEIFHLNKKNIAIGFGFILFIFGSPMYDKIINLIGRGNIMVSGSSRINIFFELLFPNNIFYMIFGRGIGQATNAAKNLGAEDAIIADGTLNTIVAQFGMIGLVLFLLASVYVSVLIIKMASNHKFIVIIFMLILGIIFITGNYFEQFSLVVLSVYSIYILLNNNRVHKGITL